MSTAPAPAEPRAALPHDLDAERTLLGAVLVDNGAWTQVGRLKAQDFYRDGHRRIFVALQHIGSRGGEMDLITVKAQLGADLQAAGGAQYLASLTDGMPRVSNVSSWLAIVRRHALLRSIHHIGQRLATATLEDDANPEEILERADAHLLKVMASGSMGSGLLDNAMLAKAALGNIEARAAAPQGILGYRTGIESLDGIVKGIRDSSMVIIGARLGEGKSMLAMQICEAIGAQAPDRVVVCSSLEMSGVELTERRLAARSCVNPTTLWAAEAQDKAERWGRLAVAVGPSCGRAAGRCSRTTASLQSQSTTSSSAIPTPHRRGSGAMRKWRPSRRPCASSRRSCACRSSWSRSSTERRRTGRAARPGRAWSTSRNRTGWGGTRTSRS
jgi:replicative DNA helicase